MNKFVKETGQHVRSHDCQSGVQKSFAALVITDWAYRACRSVVPDPGPFDYMYACRKFLNAVD